MTNAILTQEQFNNLAMTDADFSMSLGEQHNGTVKLQGFWYRIEQRGLLINWIPLDGGQTLSNAPLLAKNIERGRKLKLDLPDVNLYSTGYSYLYVNDMIVYVLDTNDAEALVVSALVVETLKLQKVLKWGVGASVSAQEYVQALDITDYKLLKSMSVNFSYQYLK